MSRDNFGFLMDLPKEFVDMVFRVLSAALADSEWDLSSLLIDIVQILITYR